MKPAARRLQPLAALLLAALPSACYHLRGTHGGGMTSFSGERKFDPRDIAVPRGYTIEKVASGLTFPTGVVFDDRDRVYVVESGYSQGEEWASPRLLRLEPDDHFSVVAEGGRNGPWTGAAFKDGAFFVIESGALEGGRILRVDVDGRVTTLFDGLPSMGDNPADAPAFGKDGMLYFGVGTMTNAGVVGEDNELLGWVSRFPERHDVPCADVVLAGRNFPSKRGPTGAFSPYGTATTSGQVIKGAVPCSGAILRAPIDGAKPIDAKKLELVAWGFRNPAGLAFDTDGRLFATDAGYELRGSRPVWGAGDALWAVSTGTWYGWPDYAGGRPLADAQYRKVEPLLAKLPGTPPKPAARLTVHGTSYGLDFSRSAGFGHVGEAFVAQFGDRAPFGAKTVQPVGFRIVRVDPATGSIEDFAVNRGKQNGPASLLGSGGLERPVAVRFDPTGNSLYIVDFGVLMMSKKGPTPVKGTGALWRVTRRS